MNNLKIAGPALPDMPVGRASRRLQGGYVALFGQPDHRARRAFDLEQHFQFGGRSVQERASIIMRGVFRCDDTNRRMRIHAGFSVDGIDWDIREEDFKLVGGDTEIGQWVYGYDPRVPRSGDKYYVTWCNGYHGPTIGVAWTEDFETFHQLENAFIPFNRNGVLFPRKIGGKFAMLSRPSDNGHTAFGDIFYSVARHGVLGTPPPRDVARGVRGFGVAVHEDRRGARAHRDQRRVAFVLPRGAPFVQRLRLCVRLGIARPG